MRIFIEPSGYTPHNIGDMAMLEVALERVRAMWPDAELRLHGLELCANGSRGWSALPRALRHPALAKLAVRAKGAAAGSVDDYLDAVRSADLFLMSGAGSLTDAFRRHALRVLDTIELALDSGAVVALAGQGIGPIHDRTLRKRAAAVLPRAHFIALREEVASLPLLESLGVPRERITVTGDDAIVLAHRMRPATLGHAIGVNLREASYSGVNGDSVGRIAEVIRNRGAELVPIPISRHPENDDLRPIGRIVGQAIEDGPTTACELLRILPRCRIVVAGSYHAAVFALSMGIPVVAIVGSAYYFQKFAGLAGQFGPACRFVRAETDSLAQAIDDAWRTAESTRAELLAAAARQIALSEAAYGAIFALADRPR